MNHSFSHKYIRSRVIPIWIKRLVSTRTRGALGDNAYRTNVGRSVASPPQYRRLGLCAKGFTKRGSFFGKSQKYDPQYEMRTVQGCLLTMNPIGISRFNSHFTSFGNPGIKSDAILGNSLRGCMVGTVFSSRGRLTAHPSGVFLALLFLFNKSTENRIQSFITARE